MQQIALNLDGIGFGGALERKYAIALLVTLPNFR
jgi:hypothetical protein